jgi:VWFA-related protein
VQPQRVQAQTAPQVEITSADTGAWPSVQVTLTVRDTAGQPIPNLTPDAFSAEIAGQPVAITNLGTTSDPGLGVAVILAFDTSGSMSGPPLDQAKAAGKTLLALLGPDDVAAVVAFADAPQTVQTFTADQAALSRAVDGLQAAGNTALYAAVAQTAALAGQAPLPRRAVVLLSDGVDFGGIGGVDPVSTITSVAGSGALFFSVGLGADIDEGYLQQLADAGHGQLLLAPAPNDLEALYQDAGNVLRQQYVLTLDGPTELAPGDVSLAVEVTAGGATAVATGVLTVPAPAVTTAPTAEPTPAPTASQAPETPGASSSSGFPWAIVVVGLAAVAAIGGGTLFLIRYRRRPIAVPEGEEQAAGELRQPIRSNEPVFFPQINRAVEAAEPTAWIEGPDERKTPLTGSPMTIGFSLDCTLQLPPDGDVHVERVRIWRRDGRYMLHNLSNAGSVMVAGRPASWVVLEDGDEIVVGGCQLLFREPS